MVRFDDDFLSEEHLDNIDNDNGGDDGVNESSSDNVVVRKILLFAFYSNQYMTTTKTKIRCDTNRLNLI